MRSRSQRATLTHSLRQQVRAVQHVSWNSSNPAVATVDSAGVVTAVEAGTAIVTATSGQYSAYCAVTVVPGV